MVLLALLLGTVGCSLKAELLSLALEFWPEYLAYRLKGTSGISEVDAVLDAKKQLDKIDEADKLVAEGRKEGDVEKIEQAIRMRPGDWRYKYQAGAVLLEQGEVQRAKDYIDSASYGGQNRVNEPNAAIEGETRVYPKDQYAIEVLEDSRQRMMDKGWKSKDQCEYTYDTLIWNYRNLTGYQMGGDSANLKTIVTQLESEKARFCPK